MDTEIKRRPPCPDYDIRGTEKWLEQMAARGYHLCEGHAFQGGWAYFIEGKPKTVRYRMDAAKKAKQNLWGDILEIEPPDDHTRQLNEEFGWKYITYRGQFHIYACEDPAAPEMHTDPQIQAIALKIVTKRQRSQLLWLIVYGMIWCFPRGELLFSTLINHHLTVFLPILIFMGLALAAWLPGLIHMTRFRKALEQGILPESSGSFSEGKVKFQRILKVLPFLFVLFAMWYSQPVSHDGIYLDTPNSVDAAVLSAADLFPEAQVEYNAKYGGYIAQWSTEASPENYELSESFLLTLPDGSTSTGDWDIIWHETRFDWVSYGYSLELQFLNWARSWSYESVTRLDVEVDGADRFLVYEITYNMYTEPHTVLILVKDNVVVKASLSIYNGEFPIQYTPQELAAAILEAISR